MAIDFTRRSTVTGSEQRVCKPEALGLDPEIGHWVTSCLAHGTHAVSSTVKLAAAATGLDYCDDCRKEKKAKEREAAKAEKTAAA